MGGLRLDLSTAFLSGFRFGVQGSVKVLFEGSFMGYGKGYFQGRICRSSIRTRVWDQVQFSNSKEP